MDKQNTVKSPQVLPGSLWGVAAFFVPQLATARKDNYMKFRAANKKQGLKLLVVELAFGNRPFQLTNKDADLLIQLRSDTILWHKEALINIGIKQLPQDCDKVVWLDTEIIFTDNSWIAKTADMLEKYKILHLFKTVVFLNKKGNICSRSCTGLFPYLANEDCSYVTNPGLAWGARREVIQKCKIYDAMVLGGGDNLFLHGLFNGFPDILRFCSNNLLRHYKEWSNKISDEIKGSFYYLDSEVTHLYHGNIPYMLYHIRDKWYRKYLFDPYEDIERDSNGCWDLKNRKIEKLAKKYFIMRTGNYSFWFIYGIPFFFRRIINYVLRRIREVRINYLDSKTRE